MSHPPKTPTESAVGFAYLIAGPDGLFKIGHSASPEQRMRQIAPKRLALSLLVAIPTGDPAALEGWLHQAFSHRRVKGEWFLLTEEEVGLICSIPAANAMSDLPAAVLALRQVNESNRFVWGMQGEKVTVPSFGFFNCRPEAEVWDDIDAVRELAAKLFPVRFSDSELLRLSVAALKRELQAKVAEMEKPKGGKK